MQADRTTTVGRTALRPQPMRQTLRLPLADGAGVTLHVARFARAEFSARVVAMRPLSPLQDWCERHGVDDALIGGFYIRADGIPLGRLRIDGRARPSVPFESPWDAIRACVHIADGEVALASPLELAVEPEGDLLQAGPMLVRDGISLVADGRDREGFSAASHQFDSDITVGRYPRAALGVSPGELIAVVCEGRADHEAGLTLAETAEAMLSLGAVDAINLDGGGSASMVVGGRLVNTPREEHGWELPGGRAICTALHFVAR